MSGADDPQFVAAGCSGKKQFVSWENANQSRTRMLKRRADISGRVSIYRCRFCHHWHIGG